MCGPSTAGVHTWCARQIRSRSCVCRNSVTLSDPKVYDTPRSFSPHPCTSLSGSAHRRSHKRPASGTSVGRGMRLICSSCFRSGDKPPCMHRIWMQHMWRPAYTNTCMHFDTQASKQTNLFIDQCRNRQAVEAISKCFPQPNGVAPLAFIVKPVDTVDGCTFVVATQQEKIFWVFDLWQWRVCDYQQRVVLLLCVTQRRQCVVAPCRPARDRWSPGSAFPGLHNHRERGSWPLGESLHTQRVGEGQSTARECLLEGLV